MNRRHFFAALFAPVLAFFGWKAAAPLRKTSVLAHLINTDIGDVFLIPRSFMFGLKTTEMETPYGSFVMVDNEALRNHARTL